jgi:hypothetical protein
MLLVSWLVTGADFGVHNERQPGVPTSSVSLPGNAAVREEIFIVWSASLNLMYVACLFSRALS